MKLLITGPFDDDVAADLRDKGSDLDRRDANVSQSELKDAIKGVAGYILGGNEMLTPEVLGQADQLKMIVFLGEQPETFMASGMNHALHERGIAMESTPGVSTNAVAEMACALILCALRRVPYLVEEVQHYRWPSVTGSELLGKTIGIYGMGKIGYTVVKRLFGFEPGRVLYSDIVRSDAGERDFGARRVELDELFAESDVISLHAPLTPQTKGIVNEELLRRMNPDAVLVNTARAGIVDPQALRKALQEGWISCAAFDGYYVEGPELMRLGPDGDPYGLLSMRERFFVTSHQGFNTRDAVRKASEVAADKLTLFFAEALERERAA